MSTLKTKRIASNIIRTLSEIIELEARDSLLKYITITDADVASDLSIAKIYFTSLSNLEKERLVKEINEAAPYLRTMLAERIDLRHTPNLKFVYDESIAYGANIERIIKEINNDN